MGGGGWGVVKGREAGRRHLKLVGVLGHRTFHIRRKFQVFLSCRKIIWRASIYNCYSIKQILV